MLDAWVNDSPTESKFVLLDESGVVTSENAHKGASSTISSSRNPFSIYLSGVSVRHPYRGR